MTKITIGIPAYNARFLDKAIASALAQTVTDFELLISDDSRNGEARHVVERFQDPRIRLIDGPRRGFAANCAHVWDNAVGDYLKFLDDDDELAYTALAELAQALERDPRYAFACCRREFVDESEAVIARPKVFGGENWVWFEGPALLPPLFRDLANQVAERSASLIRRSAFEGSSCMIRYAGLPIRRHVDVAFLMNAARAGPNVAIPQRLARLRQHPGQLSVQVDEPTLSAACFEWEIFLRGGVQEAVLPPALALQSVDTLAEVYARHAGRFPELTILRDGLPELRALLAAGSRETLTPRFRADLQIANDAVEQRIAAAEASPQVAAPPRTVRAGDFWDRYSGGRFLRQFDPSWMASEWYYHTYGAVEPTLNSASDALEHFVREGVAKGYDPTPEFSSEFYELYYPDVRRRVQELDLPSAFYHFVVAGRAEGRLTRHDLAQALRQKLRNATDIVGFSKARTLEDRLEVLPTIIREGEPRRVNVFIPSADPDIFFGGYIAFLHFLSRLAERNVRLRLLVADDRFANKEWLLHGIAGRPRWFAAFKNVEFVNCRAIEGPIPFSPSDVCVAYSAWMLREAAQVCAKLETKQAIYFAQEFEAIFHEHDGLRFMVEAAYRLPHTAVFNTTILRDYFRKMQLGVFSPSNDGRHVVFEHALADVSPPAADELRKRRQRKLIFYARPERHAARNLCDVGIVALKRAVRQGVFDDRWTFHGIGTMGTEHAVDIGHKEPLQITSRVPQDQYEQTLQSFDVGLSLMWAPHPSVIPFELSRAGVVTVTNTYDCRDAELLSGITKNLVPAEPSVEGITNALAEAVTRAEDGEARVAGAEFAWPTNWDDVFDDGFFDRLSRAHGVDLLAIR